MMCIRFLSLVAAALAAPEIDPARSSALYERVTITHGGGETETLNLMVLTVRTPLFFSPLPIIICWSYHRGARVTVAGGL